MAIVGAFAVPHPPMIIPEVGRGSEKQIESTIAAYEKVADEIAALKPETIVISSPHSVMYGDMLMQAREKCADLPVPPLLLCQDAAEIDLYGTVDAAYCSLDGFNYIPPQDLKTVFFRLRYFIRPGGLLLFDVHTPEWFRSLDGNIFVDENDDVLCLWRADFDEEEQKIVYGMDLFERRGRLWQRSGEEHVEYAHELKWLTEQLMALGYTDVRLLTDCPQKEQGRVFLAAVR